MTNENQSIDINAYEKLMKIGEGGFGEVYKVRKKGTDEIYAAKFFLRDVDINSLSSEVIYLAREVNTIYKINHPTIVKLIGVSQKNFNNEPKPVIIFEYLENKSLANIIDLERRSICDAKWDDTKKLICLYGIASGMKFIHSNRIIHRDLKALNILMDQNLFPKIADFGLAKIMHTNQSSMTLQSQNDIKGTIIYLSPEILRDQNYSKASDVYAFGMIMYEIMTLEIPFRDENRIQIPIKILNGQRPEFKFYIPEAYKNLIERCWNGDPNQRPTFEEIVDGFLNNRNFITETIDEDDFYDYVRYLDSCESTFDPEKQLFDIDLRVNRQKQETPKNKSFFSFFSNIISQPKKIYPDESYVLLNENCQKLVKEALEDPQKQFIVGQNLIEGKNNFPLDLKIGLEYLEESIKNKCVDSAYNYSKMLFRGDLIDKNKEEAKKILSKFLKTNNFKIHFLYAKILKTQFNYSEALKHYEIASKSGDGESMYQYAKLLYNGNGGKQNADEALKYYKLSEQKGNEKSANFLNYLRRFGPDNRFRKIPLGTQQFLISQIIKYENRPECEINKRFEIVIQEKHLKMLEFNHSFDKPDFINFLNSAVKVIINIDFSFNKFENVIQKIKEIKNNHISSIEVHLNIYNTKKINYLFGPSELYTEISIGPSVTKISAGAFSSLYNLSKILIPPSINGIEESLFNSCISLKQIDIPQSITIIKDHAFESCTSLTQIIIPQSVTSIGSFAFSNCTSLNQIEIPQSVTLIKDHAFESCTSLTQIIIPQSVTSIESFAFLNCTSLSQVNISSSI